ncbi:MAG: amidohydrolase family protein [Acidimicrobiia bacterium]
MEAALEARRPGAQEDALSEIVVDADGHVCEPADLWERHLPQHLQDRGIRLRWNAATGYDECWVEDRKATDRGLVGLGNAGESFDDFGRGRHYQELNPGGFDPHERVKVLDTEGIDLAVLYPGLGLKLGAIQDPELAVASCRVYNDWIAEFAAASPDRLAGVGALPLQDPAGAAEEARRIAGMGLVAGFARPNPYNDLPLHHWCYEPVYEALEETGLPLAFHPAGLADMPGASRALRELMAPGTHHALILQFDQQMTLSNLVYGGVLERHPGLGVIVLECGGGWIAHWMDRLDEFHESYGWATPPLSIEPSGYFRRQCWISFDPGERTPGVLGPLTGADRFVWASDFPHSDAKYPGVVDELRERNRDLDPEARAGLFGLNALTMYGIPAPRRA